jgi:hypothetical protein
MVKDTFVYVEEEHAYYTRLSSTFLDFFKNDVKNYIESAKAASQAVASGVGALPMYIRDGAIGTSKVVAANLQALTDVLSNAADLESPGVTAQNMVLIKYVKNKSPEFYKQLLKFGQEHNKLPVEKRGVAIVALTSKYQALAR